MRKAHLFMALGSLVGITALTSAAVAASPSPIERTWLVEDGSSRIRFERCGADLCGRIVWLRAPMDPETGSPLVDKQNPDPALRSRPLLGLVIFTGLKPEGSSQWQGTVYNADNGQNYAITIKLSDPAHLEVTGCGLGGLVCQSETWTRAD